MKIMFLILTCFLGIGVPTIEQNSFQDNVITNYEYYQIIAAEELSIGDIVIAFGSIKNNMTVSSFLYNSDENLHTLSIVTGGKTTEVVLNSRIAMAYKVAIEEEVTVKIITQNGTLFKEYSFEVPSIETFKSLAIKGEGKNKFPKIQEPTDIIDVFVTSTYIALGLIVLFTIGLVYVLRNKLGRAHPNYPKDNSWEIQDKDYNSPSIIDVNQQDYTIEEDNKTKEELTKEAYDDFEKGKITEIELNNRLRSIWWSNKDD